MCNVWRQRHLSDVIESCEEIAVALKADNPVAVVLYFNNLGNESSATEAETCSDLGFFSRTADYFPELIAFLFKKQEFDKSAVVDFFTVKTCRNNTGVVHNKKVTFFKLAA